jgi:hypothetical protein
MNQRDRRCHQCTLLDPIGPGLKRSSSDIFSPGTAAADCEDDGLEIVSLVVQAARKNAINKTRTAVSAARLITDAEPIHALFGCNQRCSKE